jgi:hypothetical protein
MFCQIAFAVSISLENFDVIGGHETEQEIEICFQSGVSEDSLIDVHVVLDE